MSSNLILGGAQLGFNYGINNDENYFSEENTHEILKTAISCGVEMVDIAKDYGNIHSIMDEINPGLKIISKIKIFSQDNLKLSLSRTFKLKKLRFLLIHDADSFTGSATEKNRIDIFINECLDADIAWGISIYEGSTLNRFIVNNYLPSLVQYPFNVLHPSDIIGDYCQKLGIETHIRSVFLQGLLIQKGNSNYQKRFSGSESLAKWWNWLTKMHHEPMDVCLRGTRIIDRKKVIGVENSVQLKAVLKNMNGDAIDCSTLKLGSDEYLLDPRTWDANYIAH